MDSAGPVRKVKSRAGNSVLSVLDIYKDYQSELSSAIGMEKGRLGLLVKTIQDLKAHRALYLETSTLNRIYKCTGNLCSKWSSAVKCSIGKTLFRKLVVAFYPTVAEIGSDLQTEPIVL